MNNIELRLQLEHYCREEYSLKKCYFKEEYMKKKSLWSLWNNSPTVITFDLINRSLWK